MAKPFSGTGIQQPRGLSDMTHGNYVCAVHMPDATKSRFGNRDEELVSSLAPFAPVNVYRIDDFPKCPADWLRSDPSRGVLTYFMPATTGKMVWFDLRGNEQHTHHVAAIISAQGINALTGARMPSAVLDQRLEQYMETCPVHGTPFSGSDKRCDKCGFDWPCQNYLSTTSVNSGCFWRDGFRGKDGQTREFVFTENVEHGVAANLIGDDRIDAFGIALFRSKAAKPPRPVYRGSYAKGLDFGLESFGATRGMMSFDSMEVAAGALVNQTVERDQQRLDFWENSPEAAFIVYYATPDLFAAITGFERETDRVSSGEGFLGSIPVGNK